MVYDRDTFAVVEDGYLVLLPRNTKMNVKPTLIASSRTTDLQFVLEKQTDRYFFSQIH